MAYKTYKTCGFKHNSCEVFTQLLTEMPPALKKTAVEKEKILNLSLFETTHILLCENNGKIQLEHYKKNQLQIIFFNIKQIGKKQKASKPMTKELCVSWDI